MVIPFNKPACTGKELRFVEDAINHGNLSGDGSYTAMCNALLEGNTSSGKALLTTSCTHALEIAAILANIVPGDEIIMPSFTFVSTANSFVLRGATIRFVDVEPATMNMDIDQVEQAITSRTRAIVPIHYGGVACDMDRIVDLARLHGLMVITDAAQGIMAMYKGRALGSIGDISAFSFHETKNVHCGEGGALMINNLTYLDRAEVIREKGTNRKRYLLGQVDKYTWVDLGSSYLPSELNAAYLYGQLLDRQVITSTRLALWNRYYESLAVLAKRGRIELPFVPEYATHNGHLFYIKVRNLQERSKLIAYAKERGVCLAFHYVPLHSSSAGQKFGSFVGSDNFTTRESERLLRLPLYYSMTAEEQDQVLDVVYDYFKPSKMYSTPLESKNLVRINKNTTYIVTLSHLLNLTLLNA
jgi:dTDP-4-amino-4,6-dideoxygalactose transaminase